jgi:hypothetical protein
VPTLNFELLATVSSLSFQAIILHGACSGDDRGRLRHHQVVCVCVIAILPQSLPCSSLNACSGDDRGRLRHHQVVCVCVIAILPQSLPCSSLNACSGDDRGRLRHHQVVCVCVIAILPQSLPCSSLNACLITLTAHTVYLQRRQIYSICTKKLYIIV